MNLIHTGVLFIIPMLMANGSAPARAAELTYPAQRVGCDNGSRIPGLDDLCSQPLKAICASDGEIEQKLNAFHRVRARVHKDTLQRLAREYGSTPERLGLYEIYRNDIVGTTFPIAPSPHDQPGKWSRYTEILVGEGKSRLGLGDKEINDIAEDVRRELASVVAQSADFTEGTKTRMLNRLSKVRVILPQNLLHDGTAKGFGTYFNACAYSGLDRGAASGGNWISFCPGLLLYANDKDEATALLTALLAHELGHHLDSHLGGFDKELKPFKDCTRKWRELPGLQRVLWSVPGIYDFPFEEIVADHWMQAALFRMFRSLKWSRARAFQFLKQSLQLFCGSSLGDLYHPPSSVRIGTVVGRSPSFIRYFDCSESMKLNACGWSEQQ